MNAKADNSGTPLHWAAFEGQEEAVQVLIAKGANVNARDEHGLTPIDWSDANNSGLSEELIALNDEIGFKVIQKKKMGQSQPSSANTAARRVKN